MGAPYAGSSGGGLGHGIAGFGGGDRLEDTAGTRTRSGGCSAGNGSGGQAACEGVGWTIAPEAL
jgi:hypothetical protein